jgi:hypothetical protein
MGSFLGSEDDNVTADYKPEQEKTNTHNRPKELIHLSIPIKRKTPGVLAPRVSCRIPAVSQFPAVVDLRLGAAKGI